MIKIFKKIGDYISKKYWNFITDREMNFKDPDYFGETSDRIAEELYDFFNGLIADEIFLTGSRVSESDKNSEKEKMPCDFTSTDELKEYEDRILTDVLNPDCKIISLYNTKGVFSALSKVTAQPTSVLFDMPCGFENNNICFKIGLRSSANDVTTDSPTVNTVNILIISKANIPISMFAVNSDLIADQIKKLSAEHIKDKRIKKLLSK